MKKTYLVFEDEMSGRITIDCETYTQIENTYKPTRAEIDACIILGREIPEELEEVEHYQIRCYRHFREHKTELNSFDTTKKEEANKMFKEFVKYYK